MKLLKEMFGEGGGGEQGGGGGGGRMRGRGRGEGGKDEGGGRGGGEEDLRIRKQMRLQLPPERCEAFFLGETYLAGDFSCCDHGRYCSTDTQVSVTLSYKYIFF